MNIQDTDRKYFTKVPPPQQHIFNESNRKFQNDEEEEVNDAQRAGKGNLRFVVQSNRRFQNHYENQLSGNSNSIFAQPHKADIQQVNKNFQSPNNNPSTVEFIPNEPTPASGVTLTNLASYYLPSQDAYNRPEVQHNSNTNFIMARPASVPPRDDTVSANWQQGSQTYAPVNINQAGSYYQPQNHNANFQYSQPQTQQLEKIQSDHNQSLSQNQPLEQQPIITHQNQIDQHRSSIVPNQFELPAQQQKSPVRRLSSSGAVKTKADHWVQQNSSTNQAQAKGAPWPVKTNRTKVLAAAREEGQTIDSESMKPIHVITTPLEETPPLPQAQDEETKAILQAPVYSQQGLLTVAKRPSLGAIAALANGQPSPTQMNRPHNLNLDGGDNNVQLVHQTPSAQHSQYLPHTLQQQPHSYPTAHPGQQNVPSWTLLKSVQAPATQIQTPNAGAPWSQKQWKSVPSPSKEYAPIVTPTQTRTFQHQQNENTNITSNNNDIVDTFSTPPTSPTKVQNEPKPVQDPQPTRTINTQAAPLPHVEKRKSIPGPGGPIFTNWATTKPPTPPSTPSQPPQNAFNFQQAQGAQQTGHPEIVQKAKAPPPVLPKPKRPSVEPQEPNRAVPQRPSVEPQIQPEHTAVPQQASGPVMQPSVKPSQIPWKSSKLSESNWPPKAPQAVAPTAAPQDFTVNTEPESKAWTLKKPQQEELKSTLEHVIRAPGSSGPKQKPKPLIEDSNVVDPGRCVSAPPTNDRVTVEGQEHLLKPSAIKAQQPRYTPEQLKAMDMTIPKAIKSISTDTEVIRCGLPEHKRPSDAENDTDVEKCINRLRDNDPTLVEINLNNMKRTPIPQIQRLLATLKENTHLKKLSLANLGLSDNAMELLLEVIETNKTLEVLNIETNFLTGNFLVRLFQSALVQQTLREVKAVNQSATFSNVQEQEMMKAIYKNRALVKVSLNLRLTETRSKVEKALIRNGELRRLQRKLEAEGWDFQEYLRNLSKQDDQD